MQGRALDGFSELWSRTLMRIAGYAAGKRIGVAVSGGGDSVALLRFLEPLHDSGLCRLVILHVDHGWRPESATEAVWVRDLAERLGIGFYGVALKAPEDGMQMKISEASARAGRLAAFAEISVKENLDVVALGHNADDQYETIIMRMLRGTSLQGLGGIRERRRVRVNGRPLLLWRPLLELSRAELRTFLDQKGQKWLEDPSNTSPKFLRNRIRNELVPLLDSLRPGGAKRVCKLASDLQAANKLVQARVRKLCHAPQYTLLRLSGDHPDFLIRETIRCWLRNVLKINEPSRAALERLSELMKAKRSGRAVFLNGKKIVRTRDGLVFVSQEEPQLHFLEKPLETGVVSECSDWDFVLDAPCAFALGASADNAASANAIWINPDIYSGPFVVRWRKPGDRFHPAGAPGGKKLARWLIDRHVPRHCRDSLTLVASGSEILWIPGMAVAEGVKTIPEVGWLAVSGRKKSP